MKQPTAMLLAMLMIATPLGVISDIASSADVAHDAPFAGGSFGGGDGSALNPYIIEDVLDLQAMNTALWANFTLGNDINASETVGWNGGLGFEPIARDIDDATFNYQGTMFSGSLEGAGFAITGLFINRAGSSFVGLFGSTSGTSKILNVTILDSSVSGVGWVGMLAGQNYGVVNGCGVSGVVHGTSSFGTGGVIGANQNTGVISNCWAMADVTGLTYLGGLAGYNAGNTITASFAMGDVTGTGNLVGGLVGYQNGNTISNCYATGNAVGDIDVGGLAGGLSGNVINSYSTGSATGSGNVGGFFGEHGSGTFTNCHWDNETSGTDDGIGDDDPDPAGVHGNTTAEMMQQTTFIGWDFTNMWWIAENQTRPFLRMEWNQKIRNSHQLQLMQMDLTADYTLANDIDLGDITEASQMWGTNMTHGSGFVPVGNNSVFFSGAFEGSGRTISGLYIDRTGESCVGLFGATTSAHLRNVTLADAYVAGNSYVGGLAGANYGMLDSCSADAEIQSAGGYGGCLLGQNGGIVRDCVAYGIITAPGTANYLGVFAGINFGPMYSCRAYGEIVSAGIFAGGLVGYNNADVFIFNSTAYGNVTGTSNYCGGLAGRNVGKIENCSAYGIAGDAASWTGGLVGDNFAGGIITNCTAYGDATGMSYVGGLVGNNAGAIFNTTSENVVTGIDNVGGLVGYNSGTVNNTATSSAVNGQGYIGGLAGFSSGSVSNSSASGTVTGTSMRVGGLIGGNEGGKISFCYATGSVSGLAIVGGLVGLHSDAGASLTASFATGNVTGTLNLVGGLVGYQFNVPISNCYARGNVAGSSSVGGLTGGERGDITNCYSTGTVTGTSDYGGFRGVQLSGTLSGCHWDIESSGITDGVGDQEPDPAGIMGHTTEEMMQQATFPGWDFATIWGIYETNSYPFLRAFGIPPEPQADLEIDMWDVADIVNVGGVITYAVVLTNRGPANAIGIYANVTLPPGTTFINSTAPFTVNGPYLEVDPANLANGEIVGAYINASVDAFTTGTVNCTAFVTSATADPGTYPNSTYEITQINRLPIPWVTPENNHVRQTTEDYPYSFPSILSDASDPDSDPISVVSHEPSDYGAALTILANGSMTYDPRVSAALQALHDGETVFDTFNYTISDGRGGFATAMITMRVDGQEGQPTAVNDTFTIQEDSGPNILTGILSNDIIDEEGDAITISSVPNSWQGTMTITGGGTTITFEPTQNYFGSFTFTYWISDGHSGTSQGSINMTVIGVNDAPFITNVGVASLSAQESTFYSYVFQGVDVDADALSWALNTNAAWLTMNAATGNLSGTPPFGSAGNHLVNLTLSDGHGGMDWLDFTLTVSQNPNNTYDPDDLDGDGVPNDQDAFPNDPNETVDTDGDGIGNNADPDDDGDGVPDTEDAFPLDPAETIDTDGDGIGNNADPDDDGDGIPDAEDDNPLIPDENEAEGGGGNFTLIIIIIVIVAVIAGIAAMTLLRPKAPKPPEDLEGEVETESEPPAAES